MHISEDTDKLREELEWFLDHLSVERGASAHTVAAYHSDLSQVAELLRKWGTESWAHYDADADAKVRAAFGKKHLAPATVARKSSAVRSLLKFLIKRGGGPQAGLVERQTGRRRMALPKALTIEETEALMSSPNVASPAGLRDRAMLELLYGTGLRVSELVALRLEDYDVGESVLRVYGKRGKTRLIPLPVGTKGWLEEYIGSARSVIAKRAAGSLVFVNARGRGLSRSGVFRILQEHANRAGITKNISPHTLRHTYAVHLVQAGADLRSVQELLGHESVATTDIYTQLDVATLRRKYDKAHPRAK